MPDKEYLIGVDIGTLGSKGVIIDDEGKILSSYFVEHGIDVLRPGWVEQDPERIYWTDFRTIVRKLIAESGVSPGKIVAVGVSSLSPDACPVDENGNPVRPALIYMDRRSVKECQMVREILGEDYVVKLTGNAVDPYFAGYKMLWIMQNEPENYKKTWKFLNACKYVVNKLTDVASVDISNAALSGPFYDVSKKVWSETVCSALGFDREKLPDVFELGDVIGAVTKRGSSETLLPEGAPVVSCAVDGLMSFYSVGCLDPGDAVLMYGTTGVMGIISDKPVWDPRFVNTYYIGGRVIHAVAMIATGALVRWFRDEFGVAEKEVERLAKLDAYSLLDRMAEKISPGSDGLVVLPYFMGERTPIWDPLARGVVIGLTLYHSRAHVYRALLESAGYALKQHILIANQLGIFIKRILAVNGGARSKLWRQIISDIIGMPQLYSSKVSGAPFGDAFLAGVAVKIFQKPEDIRKLVVIDEETKPIIENTVKYERLYSVFDGLYAKLKDDMHAVATL
ncbi:MAG: FGGY-family carbohydrate kinase [Candidatus Caldarchaeum sp.]|nr:FGGY-family carbohydrate kinase [Candidatus Caldarchaeum sp.]